MIKEETLETKIVTNAADHFLNKGFKSVTMDDLASSMGMSKKTIYTYFKTKSDLINEVANYLFDIISTGIDFICDQKHNPIEELYKINDFVQKNLKNEYTSPLYQLQKYYPETHKELFKKQFEATHSCILENLKNGINAGLYRDCLDIEFISRLYFILVTGIKNEEFFPKEVFPTHKTIITYLDYHIRGIATNKGVITLEKIQQKRKQ